MIHIEIGSRNLDSLYHPSPSRSFLSLCQFPYSSPRLPHSTAYPSYHDWIESLWSWFLAGQLWIPHRVANIRRINCSCLCQQGLESLGRCTFLSTSSFFIDQSFPFSSSQYYTLLAGSSYQSKYLKNLQRDGREISRGPRIVKNDCNG